MVKKKDKCCCKQIGILILIAAVLWLLEELAVIALNIPYLPIIVLLAVIKAMMMKNK